MLKKVHRCIIASVAGMAAIIATSGISYADLTLDPAASAAGFTLTTFADQIPTNGAVGPVGISFTPTGGVIIASYGSGVNAVFASDTDNQHFAGAVLSTDTFAGPAGIAHIGNNYYEAIQFSGQVIQIDGNTGNFVANVASIGGATGLVANPVNGHLFVSNVNQVFDLNPADGSVTVFANIPFDGMAITPDGKTLYGAASAYGQIFGYDTTTGLQVYASSIIPGGIDGSALGTGTLAGNMFVNTNSGTLVELNLTTNVQTLIASGGSRGDFVEVDPNGSLLLTQTDSVLRLTAPTGGGFSTVPEPSSFALMGLGGIGLAIGAYRRKRVAAV